jgi:phosphotransferase system HPr-like phosphotransfer protein
LQTRTAVRFVKFMELCDTQTEGSKGGETFSDTLSLGVMKLAASPITTINIREERSEAANVFGTLATFCMRKGL